jgi:hypothetical protein
MDSIDSFGSIGSSRNRKASAPMTDMHIRRHVTMLRDELTALLLRLNELDKKSTA